MGLEDHEEELSRYRQRWIVELEKKAAVQKKIEEAITLSEIRYRRLFEANPDGILIVDAATGLIIDVNPFFLKLSGYSLSELLGKKLQETGPFQNMKDIKGMFSERPSTEFVRYDDVPFETKDGQIVDVEVIGNVYMVNQEKVMQWNVRSTMDRKLAEEALRASERHLQELFSAMTEGVAVHSIIHDESGAATDYVILNVNPAYEHNTGIKKEQAMGRKGSELYGTGKPPYLDIYEEVVATGHPIHFETYFAPMQRHFKISVFSPGRGLFATVFDDITDRKKVENALRESEKRFSDIAENAREWIWEVDSTGKYTFSSNVVETILGYRADELLGTYFYDLFHPEDREELKRTALESFALKRPFREFLNRNMHKSGKAVWLSTSGVPLLDDNGNLLGYRGADTDVTEMISTAEALRDSEEVFRSITQSALDAIILVDGGGAIRLWNHAAERLLGYAADEILGNPVTIIIPERFRAEHRRGMQKFVSSGKSRTRGRHLEMMIRHKDGQEFPVEISLASWERKGDVFFTGIIRDLTVRKQLEEKLREVSITDELTGLLNRRGFLTLAKKHIEIARRNKRNFSLLYLDLNEMKKINDAYGHRAGDQALLDIAEILRKTFRASDIIARIGGDEFTVLITETLNQAIEHVVGQHIQDNLRLHNERADKGYALSVSMGMVHYDPYQPCTVEELLARADELMYEHKQGDREMMPSSRGEKREERGYERYKAGVGPLTELAVSGSALINNISLGGIALRTAQRLMKNTVYTVKIPCRTNGELSMKGLVVWSSFGGVMAEKGGAEPYFEAGLKFVELDESVRHSLEQYVLDLAT